MSWQNRFSSFLFALLIPLFAIQVAITYPIEERAFDAAAFHIWRGAVFSDAHPAGLMFPRWVMPINGGLGSPMFSFYSPLSYMLMDKLAALGLSHTMAWRILVAIALMIGAAGMYGLGRHLFRREDVALVAAACFTYAPYYLRDFFERGAPQGIAIALYPCLLYALLALADQPSGMRFVLAAVCWFAILMIHNLSAVLVVPLIGLALIYIFVSVGGLPPKWIPGKHWYEYIRAIFPPILALILGTMLSAYHVYPFLMDSKYIQINAASQDPTVQPALNPLALRDVLALPPIYDLGFDNNQSGLGVGLLHLLAVMLAIPAAILLWQRLRRAEALLVGGLALFGLFTLFMQLDAATPIWKAIYPLNILQFRTRQLNTFGIIAAICVGYVLILMPERVRKTAIPVLIGMFILLPLPSLYPLLQHRYATFPPYPTVQDAQTYAFANNVPGLTLTTSKELMPIWRGKAYFTEDEVRTIAAAPLENLPDGARIINDEREPEKLRILIDSPKPFQAVIHLLYYPGWIAYLNSQPQPINAQAETGYILMDVPAGTNTLELRYQGTPAQQTGYLITIVSVILAFGVLFWRIAPITKHYVWDEIVALRVPLWVFVLIIAVFLVKVLWIDPSGVLLRASTCDRVQEAVTQINVQFGENIRLCGYTLETPAVIPGGSMRITLYWQINQTEKVPYSSFVHLLGQHFNPATNNPLWGQQDKQYPGTLPTSLWVPGKLYQDTYEFSIPANTPPDDYQLEIGWLSPDGQRLKPTLNSSGENLSVSELKSLLIGGLIAPSER